MSINIVNSAERQNAKSHPILVVTAITAALLFTIVSGLFPGSSVALDVGAYTAFAQEQNQLILLPQQATILTQR